MARNSSHLWYMGSETYSRVGAMEVKVLSEVIALDHCF